MAGTDIVVLCEMEFDLNKVPTYYVARSSTTTEHMFLEKVGPNHSPIIAESYKENKTVPNKAALDYIKNMVAEYNKVNRDNWVLVPVSAAEVLDIKEREKEVMSEAAFKANMVEG